MAFGLCVGLTVAGSHEPISLRSVYPEFVGDQLKSRSVFELLNLRLQFLQLHLPPRGTRVMVQFDELPGQSVEFWISLAGGPIIATEELADVEEGHNQEVEGVYAALLDRKATV